MPSLRPPGLGPIVGHTTHESCRLWIRAGDPGDRGADLASERRTVGVLGVMDGTEVRAAYYFRLHREFDRTGTFVLGREVSLCREPKPRDPGRDAAAPFGPDEVFPLAPDTAYAVRLGTLTTDDPWPDDASVGDAELAARLPPVEKVAEDLIRLPADLCEATFRTFPAPAETPGDRLAFLLGSCRYPGLLWKVKEADRIFGPMLRHLLPAGADPGGPAEPARFTLMVGDQIYADALHRLIPLARADTYEEFQARYHEAFGAPNLRRLLRTAPAYMILDDHEIENNWTQDRLDRGGKHELFNLAIGAYMSYQWSHGPRDFGRLLYYTFTCGGYPFFVLDTRTQRFKDDEIGLDDNHMLGRPTIDPRHPSQLRRLKTWLTEQQRRNGDAPKFVVSSSVFAPSAINERLDPAVPEENRRRREASDSWPAYPETRRGLLEHLVAERIQNVVFLCGDVHCASVAELRFSGTAAARRLKAFCITSSSFYWPFPFANGDPNGYVHDSTASGQVDTFRFRVAAAARSRWTTGPGASGRTTTSAASRSTGSPPRSRSAPSTATGSPCGSPTSAAARPTPARSAWPRGATVPATTAARPDRRRSGQGANRASSPL